MDGVTARDACRRSICSPFWINDTCYKLSDGAWTRYHSAAFTFFLAPEIGATGLDLNFVYFRFAKSFSTRSIKKMEPANSLFLDSLEGNDRYIMHDASQNVDMH